YLKNELAAYQQSYQIAKTYAEKIRLMHDKLNAEIEDLNACRGEIKAKMKVAKAKQQVSSMASKIGVGNSASIFEAMNEKAQRLIDEADAMAELNTPKEDTIDALTLKYSESNEKNPVVEDDLERLKKELGL
ncbi:MAG TPA: PspA/IM30 family protein, partial [Caldisericia bacterium]|nr:PspA/IM30 family protein [Caldisericia bacterium]